MRLPNPTWPPVVPYLRAPRRRAEDDQRAARHLNWRRFDNDLPRGLELQWLGTAGFRISYQETRLLIDPYLSRAPLSALLLRRPLSASTVLVDRHVPEADAVLMGHTHFDHALDAPLIARRRGCPVYGSRSLRQLMALHGLPERAVAVEVDRPFEIGPFKITFIPSVHSRLLLGLAVPYDGELDCNRLDRLTHSAYRSGQVYGILIEVAGIRLYHQGSANLLEEPLHRARGVDYFLACISGRGFTTRFWERILPLLRPSVLVPHHFDDFMRPLDGEISFSFNVNLAGLEQEVHAVDPHLPIRCLEPLQAVNGGVD